MAKSPLKFDRGIYYPNQVLRILGLKELRKEYSRLRAIAVKRIKRLKESEFADAEILKYNTVEYYTPLKGMTVRDIQYKISDLARFLDSPVSTVTGQRKRQAQTLATLKRHGYGFVTAKNLLSFGRWMEYAKAKAMSKYFDSERAAEIFRDAEEETGAEEMYKEYTQYETEQIKQRALSRRRKRV